MNEIMKKQNLTRIAALLLIVIALLTAFCAFALAEPAEAPADSAAVAETVEAAADPAAGSKAIAASIAIGLAAAAGAIAMGIAIAKSSEGIARQPEAAEKIRTSLMLGLVFIETAIIYALIVAILIVFVL